MSTTQEIIEEKKKEVQTFLKNDTRLANMAFYILWLVRTLFLLALVAYVIMNFFVPTAYKRVPGSIPSITGILNIIAYFQNFSEWITRREEHIKGWRKKYMDIIAVEHMADPTQTAEALELLLKNVDEQKNGKPLTEPSVGVAAAQLASRNRETSAAMQTLQRSQSIAASVAAVATAATPAQMGMGVASLGLAVAGIVSDVVNKKDLSSSSSDDTSDEDTSSENATFQRTLSSQLQGTKPTITDAGVSFSRQPTRVIAPLSRQSSSTLLRGRSPSMSLIQRQRGSVSSFSGQDSDDGTVHEV